MLDHKLVQRLVFSIADQLLRRNFIESAGFLDQTKESPPAIGKMIECLLDLRRSKWVDVKTYILSTAPVFVPFQDADLVKSASQIRAPERFILVEFEPVLVVQVQR